MDKITKCNFSFAIEIWHQLQNTMVHSSGSTQFILTISFPLNGSIYIDRMETCLPVSPCRILHQSNILQIKASIFPQLYPTSQIKENIALYHGFVLLLYSVYMFVLLRGNINMALGHTSREQKVY